MFGGWGTTFLTLWPLAGIDWDLGPAGEFRFRYCGCEPLYLVYRLQSQRLQGVLSPGTSWQLGIWCDLRARLGDLVDRAGLPVASRLRMESFFRVVCSPDSGCCLWATPSGANPLLCVRDTVENHKHRRGKRT